MTASDIKTRFFAAATAVALIVVSSASRASEGYGVLDAQDNSDIYRATFGDKANEEGQISVFWNEGPHLHSKEGTIMWDAYFSDGNYGGIKVSDEVYSIKDGQRQKVLGINSYHRFALEALTGPNRGRHSWEIEKSDLAMTSGCVGNICVNQKHTIATRDGLVDVTLVLAATTC